MQVLFRSVNKLLMDTATAEYLFCCDFFQEDTIFSELFTTTLAVVESSLAASIQVAASSCFSFDSAERLSGPGCRVAYRGVDACSYVRPGVHTPWVTREAS